MQRIFTPMHVFAALIGLACLGVDWYSNIEFIYAQTKTYYDSSIYAVVAVGLGGTMALSASYKAFRQKALLSGSMLLVGFFLAAAFSLTATLDRVSTQRDTAIRERIENDKEAKRLYEVRNKFNYLATREQFEGGKNRKPGKGDAYDAAKAEEQIANALLEKRMLELDSGAQRIAAMVPFLSVEKASMYQPVFLPFALFILANWLIAFGVNGERVPREFNMELKGKDAQIAKLTRYVSEFEKTYGRPPSRKEVADTLGVSQYVAKNLLAKV